jgi:hypothetical protein
VVGGRGGVDGKRREREREGERKGDGDGDERINAEI